MSRNGQIALLVALVGCLGACVGGWVSEDSPTNADLYGVWGATSTDVFAVGANGTVLMRRQNKWRELDSGTDKTLYGVWGTGQEHVVVVGDDCAAYEYNGEPEDPPEGEKPPDLREISAETCLNFRSIDGTRSDLALVVGERSLSRNMQRYNGSGLGNAPMCGDRLLGISHVADETAFAVGDKGALCSFDGSWREQQVALCPVDLQGGLCPTDPMYPVLWGVWVGENGQGAVVGSYGGLWRYPPPEGSAEDPFKWKPVDTGIATDIRGVHGWVDPGASDNATTIYAVGSLGVLIRLRGEKLTREAPGTNEDLHDVWVSDDGKHVYAVGAKGTILHYSD